MREAFIRIDDLLHSPEGKKEVLKYKSADSGSSTFGRPYSDDIPKNTGCTACVALITANEIICANAGDSRCVLSNNGNAVELSFDHKPDNHEEK